MKAGATVPGKRLLAVGLLVAVALAAVGALLLRPVPPPKKLTVAVTRSADSALIYVAQMRGYFRDEGLDVTLQVHDYGKVALDSMLEGKADLAASAETPIVLAILRGKPLVVVAGIFSSDRDMGVVARRDKGIHFPMDLRGKRVAATPGTNGEYFRHVFLAAAGISERAVEPVALPPEKMADALGGGKADAVAVWQPFLAQCEKRLGAAGITFQGQSVYTYTFNLAATHRIVTEDHQALESFLRALRKAETHVEQHPEESAEMVGAATGLDRNTLNELWGAFTFRLSLEQMLVLEMENEARWAISEKLVPKTKVPNFLDYIYFDALEAVHPEAVLITHEERR